MRFDLRELAGSLGDLGTFIPLAVALALAADLDFGWMLVAAGSMNIASGFIFRMPLPVQPMKAIATVAIAEGLSRGEVVAAGWVMGVSMILLSLTGLIPIIDRAVPRPVVRAIQLGLGIKLLIAAWESVSGLPWVGIDSITAAAIIALILIFGLMRNLPIVLPIFLAGFVLLAIHDHSSYSSLALDLPHLDWLTPKPEEWRAGVLDAALPQLPLTLLNSVIAVCALSSDYFPKRQLSARRIALSVGLMNLFCIAWSGLPMCHGSGGLAGQYRAGARTGGSVVMLGAIKVIVGLAFGASLLPLLAVYPKAALSPLIGLAGFALARAGIQKQHAWEWFVTLAAALSIVILQTLQGFIIGVILYVLARVFLKTTAKR